MDGPHLDPLRSSSHHWHVVGASMSALYLDCCGCGQAMVVDTTPDAGTWLRFSLMQGGELVGRGRGLMMGDCPAGSRRLSIDGYEERCSLVDGCHPAGELLRHLGLPQMGLVEGGPR